LLQVDVTEIVMHEAYDPDAVVNLPDAYALTGQYVRDADLLAMHADATAFVGAGLRSTEANFHRIRGLSDRTAPSR
jgi:hypothetical protein